MKNNTRYSFGIDFGTTNSVVAFVSQEKELRSIRGAPDPSVVLYQGKRIIVGHDAKVQFHEASADPNLAIFRSIKRELRDNSPYYIGSRRILPIEISSEIFKHLRKRTLEAHNTKIEEAVVTVPIYFDGQERRALREAAQMAGIHIRMFLHEPTAAIIRYYVEMKEPQYIAVFDWGGGTLDITLAHIFNNKIEELALGGVVDKSGDYFDQLIFEHVWRDHRRRFGYDDTCHITTMMQDEGLWACEGMKRDLSEKVVAPIEIWGFDENHNDLEGKLNRDQFENLIEDAVNRAIQELDTVLGDSGLKRHQLNRILLIGGSCRIPVVIEKLKREYGSIIDEMPRPIGVTDETYHHLVPFNPVTSIAEGAAIIASKSNCVPYLARHIGIEASNGRFETLIEKGKPLSKQEELQQVCTLAVGDTDSGYADVKVFESKDGRECDKLLGHLKMPVDKNSLQNQIKLQISIDADDFILNIAGTSKSPRQIVERTIEIPDLKYGLELI